MHKDFVDQHEREWDSYCVQYQQAFEELLEKERSLRIDTANADGFVPASWELLLRQKRGDWLKKWGARGSHIEAILKRQELAEVERLLPAQQQDQQETIEVEVDEQTKTIKLPHGYSVETFTEQEVEEMYNQLMEDTLERERMAEQSSMSRYSNAVLKELDQERHAIEEHYELADTPVPEAAQRRIEKRFAAIQNMWSEKAPETPVSEMKAINTEDLKDEPGIWRQLMFEHKLITDSYGGLGKVPHASQERMDRERQDLQNEIDLLKEVTPPQPELTEFKNQIELMRQRTNQTPKLKGPG